eukprot:TRINITY_DN20541_c0_g1_i2.p1 TRINITY_DN20541_c0_g1~~TRINITY_DN20541_c0_g1_i2.p1  ORF type:complete len:342 (+),score=75.73 TRINITY_DN20541_c0_g1_i2:63-1088(+)
MWMVTDLDFASLRVGLCDLSSLTYSSADGIVRDDTGTFQLREEDRVEEALGLRMLAARCNVAWRGDDPSPASQLALIDTDGDKLEFMLTDAGKLCELNNGQLELEEVRTLHFNFSSGTIQDDSGEFTLSQRCMQQVAVLYSLAQQSGTKWSGDDPFLPSGHVKRHVLDIENCDSGWEFQCPKVWEGLSVTDKANERYCETCKEVVYFCSTEAELEEHTRQRRCVAFDLGSTAVEETNQGSDDVVVHATRLSGEELPALSVPPTTTVSVLKQRLAALSGIPAPSQRLLNNGEELPEEQVLSALGVPPGDELVLQILQVPKPVVPERRPGGAVRMMGKRRSLR